MATNDPVNHDEATDDEATDDDEAIDDESTDGMDDGAKSNDADADSSSVVAMVDAMDINADVDLNPSDCSYIHNDAAFLSKAPNAIFPCTIQYMDLMWLGEHGLDRCEPLMLIRDEWTTMMDIFNNEEKSRRGSVIFTGQPGIGKSCYYLKLAPSIK